MKKVAFCAVSGNGMSPLAQILVKRGYDVRGSDISFDAGRDHANLKAIKAAGIKVFPQNGSMIDDDLDFLCVSSAIMEDNPDIKAAQNKGIKIIKRSELLAQVFHEYKYNIAVGGTAGKTTTTAMIGYILDKLGKKPCMIDGGMLKNYDNPNLLPNYIYNEGDICVAEADESDGSIRSYHPYVALVNNISHDHVEIPTLVEYFSDFAAHARHALVVNGDCPLASKLSHKNKFVFSVLDPNADLFASNIKTEDYGVSYQIEGKKFKLNIIGKFNVSNALAAIACCMMIGVDKFDAAKALEGFIGIKRRLDVVGTSLNGITVIDDFAHNASKIEASLKAIKEHKGRVIVMYQSHKPFSARTTGEEDGVVFGNTLDKDDVLLMPEIYMRDPIKDADISGADLVRYAQKNGVNALFLETKDKVKQYIIDHAQTGDRIVIMGARDNSLPDFCKQILKELDEKPLAANF